MSDRWPALLSREDAAEYLGMGKTQFSLLIASGKIRGVKFYDNSHPKYKRVDLDALIDSLKYGEGFCAATDAKRSTVIKGNKNDSVAD